MAQRGLCVYMFIQKETERPREKMCACVYRTIDRMCIWFTNTHAHAHTHTHTHTHTHICPNHYKHTCTASRLLPLSIYLAELLRSRRLQHLDSHHRDKRRHVLSRFVVHHNLWTYSCSNNRIVGSSPPRTRCTSLSVSLLFTNSTHTSKQELGTVCYTYNFPDDAMRVTDTHGTRLCLCLSCSQTVHL